MRKHGLSISVLFASALSMAAGQALAWGDSGHRMITEAALYALPKGMPAFLYAPRSALDAGQFAREPDIWRKAGAVHDADRDPAHLMRLGDDGKTLAGLAFEDLPQTRSEYEAALRAKGEDPAHDGYLFYSIIDAYEQVAKDFALLRTIALAQTRETDTTRLVWLKEAERRRQDLTLRDIGVLSHYVGDATQPMHVSIHYDGWGNYPNPEGFTTASIHWPLEAEYIRLNVTPAAVAAAMPAPEDCTGTPEACTAHILHRDFAQVMPLYRLEKDGGFKGDDPRGKAFMTGRIAQGAADLRDMLSRAWDESDKTRLGFSGATFEDAKAGKITDLYMLLYGDS